MQYTVRPRSPYLSYNLGRLVWVSSISPIHHGKVVVASFHVLVASRPFMAEEMLIDFLANTAQSA